jgi:citrate lyase subunit beta/citryl-CoA lyase
MTRSFLFVPGDSGKKLLKAAESDADAVIVDLEDSVAGREKPRARSIARDFLSQHGELELWVRINPLDTEDALADLRSLMPSGPTGIVLPKPHGARDAVQLGKLLDVLEQEYDLPAGSTSVLPIATERPAALFHLHEYIGATPRLAGLTWGAEDLSAAVGALRTRDDSGNWLEPYGLARSLCLSVAIINEAFLPSNAEVERAQRIVDLFAESPDAGAIGLEGKMLDRPHLTQAREILELAKLQSGQRK